MSLAAEDGERQNFHRSARAPPVTRRHAALINRRYDIAGHSLTSRLCRVPGPGTMRAGIASITLLSRVAHVMPDLLRGLGSIGRIRQGSEVGDPARYFRRRLAGTRSPRGLPRLRARSRRARRAGTAGDGASRRVASPAGGVGLGALLDDEQFFAPFRAYFDLTFGRPSVRSRHTCGGCSSGSGGAALTRHRARSPRTKGLRVQVSMSRTCVPPGCLVGMWMPMPAAAWHRWR